MLPSAESCIAFFPLKFSHFFFKNYQLHAIMNFLVFPLLLNHSLLFYVSVLHFDCHSFLLYNQVISACIFHTGQSLTLFLLVLSHFWRNSFPIHSIHVFLLTYPPFSKTRWIESHMHIYVCLLTSTNCHTPNRLHGKHYLSTSLVNLKILYFSSLINILAISRNS